MPKKLTQEDFLAKALAVHGVGRYDYSQAVYVRSSDKVKINCPEHGVFEQTPSDHLHKVAGCSRCRAARISAAYMGNTQDFITTARAVHGDTYDYSQVIYTGYQAKIKIACPLHGVFEQAANLHLRGTGCPRCGRLKCDTARLHTTPGFVTAARAVHGDTYDYSQVTYVGSNSKVKIGCLEHGLFKQAPAGHLMGSGCPICRHIKSADARRGNAPAFIVAAQAAHGTRYDYSQVVYAGSKTRVKIACPQHGVFEQSPNSHLKGHGCPNCARETLNELHRLSWASRAAGRPCTLYMLRLYTESECFYKVGITFNSVAERYRSNTLIKGYSYEILAQHTSPDAARIFDWEQSILETFAHLKYNPKQRFGGETECFSSADEILAIFPL